MYLPDNIQFSKSLSYFLKKYDKVRVSYFVTSDSIKELFITVKPNKLHFAIAIAKKCNGTIFAIINGYNYVKDKNEKVTRKWEESIGAFITYKAIL